MADLFSQIGDALSGALPVLARVAPTLATAVGGPLAGTAVTFLESALGVSGGPAVAAALQSATPDQLAALKKADNDFEMRMRQLDISIDQMDDNDKASARAREMAVKDRTPSVLAFALTLGFFGLLGALLFHAAPEVNQGILNVMLGALGTAWVSMVAYYYGNSHGKAATDVMLYNSVPAAGGAAPARPLSQ